MIGPDGQQIGILALEDALEEAARHNLDLVEISPQARPPVCRIMDYGKYKYEQKKRAHEAKKKQTVIEVKEVKIRPRTDKHDLEVKARNIFRFLAEGNRARVSVVFRGREMTHLDIGEKLIKTLLTMLGEAAVVEQGPHMEGRAMTMQLTPGKFDPAKLAELSRHPPPAAEPEDEPDDE